MIEKAPPGKKEQDEIIGKLEQHQNANRSYLDEGVKLLELAQHAVILYKKQTEQEKHRITNFVCSNSIWKGGQLHPNYRQPFDILVETNMKYQKKKAFLPKKKDLIDFWLPSTDSNRGPSG